jgi:hypothetical protein
MKIFGVTCVSHMCLTHVVHMLRNFYFFLFFFLGQIFFGHNPSVTKHSKTMSASSTLPALPTLSLPSPNTSPIPASPGLDLYPPTPDPQSVPTLNQPKAAKSSAKRVHQHRLREKQRLQDAKTLLTTMVKSISSLPAVESDIDYKTHYLILASSIHRLNNVMNAKKYETTAPPSVLPSPLPTLVPIAPSSPLQDFFENILPPTPMNNQ